jgi:hypothetical protein
LFKIMSGTPPEPVSPGGLDRRGGILLFASRGLVLREQPPDPVGKAWNDEQDQKTPEGAIDGQTERITGPAPGSSGAGRRVGDRLGAPSHRV